MIFRAVQLPDLTQLLHLDQQDQDDHWTKQQIEHELAIHHGWGMVVESKRTIQGFAFFRVCLPEGELLKLIVAENQRCRGVGHQLLSHALTYLADQGVTHCYLEVRQSNQAARRLYEKLFFHQVGRRSNYYQKPREDALVLCKQL